MIPETPLGWSRITLGEIGSFNTSSVDKLIDQNQQIIPLVNYLDVFKNTHLDSLFPYFLTSVTPSKLEKFSLRRGDILFTPSSETYDEIGYSAVITEDFEAVHSYHTVRLRPSGDFPLDIRFSGYFLNAEYVLNQFSKLASGATRKTLKLSDFSNTEVLIPESLIEQRSIANILDSAMNRIANLSGLINKLEMMREGMLNDLLTLGVGEDGSLRDPDIDEFQETDIGRIPAAWSVSTIGDEFSTKLGKMLSPVAKRGVQYPYLTNRNVRWGRFELGDIESMNFSDEEREIFRLIPGDLLLCEGGDVGRCAVWEGEILECYYQKALHRLRSKGNLTTLFGRYYLQWSKGKGILQSQSSKVSIAHLTQEKLQPIPIPVPDAVEIRMITDSLQIIDRRIRVAMSELTKCEMIKAGLQNDLLTGAQTIPEELLTSTEAVA